MNYLLLIKRDKKHALHILAGIIIVFFPLVPLLVYRYFYIDFANNLWLIQYFARYFEIHHYMPLVINSSNELVGMTNPLYYGYLYYQLMGLMAALIGGARRALIFCVIIELALVYIIFSRLFCLLFSKYQNDGFIIAHGITMLMM